LGLDKELIGTNPDLSQSFILHNGRLEPIPEGFYLLAPTRLAPLLTTRLLSIRGKLRAAMEPLVPARRGLGDESVGSFVRRRLGREVLDRLAQPLLGGVHNCDPDRLSLDACLPRFRDMERKDGSLLKGMARHRVAGSHKARGARYSLFVTFRTGIRTLADSLLSRLPEGCVSAGSSVTGLAPISGGTWEIRTGGSTLTADSVVLALQPSKMLPLLAPLDPEWKELLTGVPAHDSATWNLGFKKDQVKHPLDGFGFVVPENEGALTLGTTFSSRKFGGRAPEGCHLVRTFLGRRAAEALDADGEPAVLKKVYAEVGKVLGLTGDPVVSRLTRYRSSMSYYLPGHLSRADRMRRKAAETPGLFLAGNGLSGSGIPDCIATGEAAAEALWNSPDGR
jgi:protoporphyrinogen/coproporphyrinogen III oxidase